jgi:hypothetical protein
MKKHEKMLEKIVGFVKPFENLSVCTNNAQKIDQRRAVLYTVKEFKFQRVRI